MKTYTILVKNPYGADWEDSVDCDSKEEAADHFLSTLNRTGGGGYTKEMIIPWITEEAP